MIVPAIFGILLVAGLLAWGVHENGSISGFTNSLVGTAQDTVDGVFKLHEDCTQDGSCVAFFANKEPEQHEDMDAGYLIADVQEATYYENGTEIPNTSYVTGVVTDTSYTKQGVAQQNSIVGSDGQMLVQIGNIASIQTQIKILDQYGEIIEPRYYDYYLTIKCDDSVEFCNLSPPVSRRGTTTSAGTFLEKWTTNYENTEGLYKVDVLATSDAVDSFNQRYETKGTLYIELFK